MAFKDLPRAGRLYVVFLVVAGVATAVSAMDCPLQRPPDYLLLIYVGMALLTARMNVKIPFTNVHFSVDTAFVFAILILYGLIPALIADALGKLILSAGNLRKGTVFKIPFNVASGVVSVFAAYQALRAWHAGGANPTSAYLPPILTMVLAYYVVNTGSVALAICITERVNLVRFWIKNFLPTGLAFLAAGSVATLLFILHLSGGSLGFVVTMPIVALVYYSQRIYLQKEEAALCHIEELERLHLSTIQALALAIDAKDEYTHGHVHRVRSYAVGLARRLGITDEARLKGISFSALVHDIGKIAIPDAILNKPGKYSDHEMLRMQVHPVLGSEILKSIPLPFPVARIVRAHHEKWNGRGYPDGLAGGEIPYEGRLLAVADVYDAIRSHRPYRPKMEKERAVGIMLKEKGVSLDPEMVDVFLAHLDELERNAEIEESTITDIVKASYLSLNLDETGDEPEPAVDDAQTRRVLFLFNGLSHLLATGRDLAGVLRELSAAIGAVVPYSALAIYVPDATGERLLPVSVDGKDAETLRENVLDVGSGITGWTFARQAPTVQPPADAEFSATGLRYASCLSIPLTCLNEAVGAVTLYSEIAGAFSGEDQDLLMKISPIVGPIVKNLVADDRAAAVPPSSPDRAADSAFAGEGAPA